MDGKQERYKHIELAINHLLVYKELMWQIETRLEKKKNKNEWTKKDVPDVQTFKW